MKIKWQLGIRYNRIMLYLTHSEDVKYYVRKNSMYFMDLTEQQLQYWLKCNNIDIMASSFLNPVSIEQEGKRLNIHICIDF